MYYILYSFVIRCKESIFLIYKLINYVSIETIFLGDVFDC